MNFAGYTNELFEVKSRVVYSLEELTNYDFSQCWLYNIVKYDKGYVIRFRGDAIPFDGAETGSTNELGRMESPGESSVNAMI